MAQCRACQAPLLWVLTEAGKRMPLDYEPYSGEDPRGLFTLRDGAQGLVAISVTESTKPDELRYRSHWATCSDPNRFRK